MLDQKTFNEIHNKYNDLIIVTSHDLTFDPFNIPVFRSGEIDLYENFRTYIYTPIKRKFDCSNRMIAECKLLGKNVIYYLDENYFEEDLGLKYRKLDIEKDDFTLNKNDEIIKILNQG
jgi:hypothetical protein